jgi:hypothetical protein
LGAAAVLFATGAWADDYTNRVGITLGGGAYKLVGGNLDHTSIGPWMQSGLRFGWKNHWDIEGTYRYGFNWDDTKVFRATTTGLDLGLLWSHDADAKLVWQAFGGSGVLWWNVDDFRGAASPGLFDSGRRAEGFRENGDGATLNSSNWKVYGGVGAEYFLTPRFSLRGLARIDYLFQQPIDNSGASDSLGAHNDPAKLAKAKANVDANDWMPAFAVTLTYWFGERDSDQDGIPNRLDQCRYEPEDKGRLPGRRRLSRARQRRRWNRRRPGQVSERGGRQGSVPGRGRLSRSRQRQRRRPRRSRQVRRPGRRQGQLPGRGRLPGSRQRRRCGPRQPRPVRRHAGRDARRRQGLSGERAGNAAARDRHDPAAEHQLRDRQGGDRSGFDGAARRGRHRAGQVPRSCRSRSAGHTDSRGSAVKNEELSRQRAQAVLDYSEEQESDDGCEQVHRQGAMVLRLRSPTNKTESGRAPESACRVQGLEPRGVEKLRRNSTVLQPDTATRAWDEVLQLAEVFDDLPLEALLKEDLLRRGVAFLEPGRCSFRARFKPKAYFIFSFDMVPLSDLEQGENLRAPEEIALAGGSHGLRRTIVSVRLNPASPYNVEVEDGRLVLRAGTARICRRAAGADA